MGWRLEEEPASTKNPSPPSRGGDLKNQPSAPSNNAIHFIEFGFGIVGVLETMPAAHDVEAFFGIGLVSQITDIDLYIVDRAGKFAAHGIEVDAPGGDVDHLPH